MKANVFDLEGNVKEKIDLPKVFSAPYRPDLIKRAVLAAQANRRQKYGADPMAGKRTSAHYHGKTHLDPDQRMMGRDMARLPREHGDTSRFMRARLVPHAVGGRRA
ncbi:MAG TPA: 50S ribosomal protein L4, partial [Candidatus Aenigmarchaeota archaeon]|nr:50S ribosomal protein L4 [Candidatus Aenigmarchaeota archaeon]